MNVILGRLMRMTVLEQFDLSVSIEIHSSFTSSVTLRTVVVSGIVLLPVGIPIQH